jgi:oxygen-independent coproporphyrinogen-3 oxidase
MGRLLEGLGALLPEGVGEFTVEANPESADQAFLEACRRGGVTRISLGVQTFYEPSRRAVRRVGEGALLPERLRLVSDLFGDNFSADLITGLPFQDETIVSRDIEKLLSYGPGHISLYSLTPEPGTPLDTKLLPPADEADRLWILGRDLLEKAGYEQYEVSNFARRGKRCRHNIRYWRMESWLGLGPAASGTIIDDTTGTGRRYKANPDIDHWLAARASPSFFPGAEEEEGLDSLTLMKETLLMGFRYIEGPDPALFRRRFGLTLEEAIPASLAKWRERGLLFKEKTALTSEGLLFLNNFLLETFEELP